MTAYWLIIAAGLGAGFVNAIAGGGMLLTFPALFYCGLPGMNSVTANATSTAALWTGSLTSAWTYRHELRTNRQQVIALAVPSLIGGLAGALLLINMPERAFRAVVPYLILFACALQLLADRIGRWMAARSTTHPRQHAVALWLTQLAVAVYGGYFGAGIGILMLAALAIFLPGDLQTANGMKNLLAFLINATAGMYFLAADKVVWQIALILILAVIIGGFVGARTAQRMSPRVLRAAVVLFGVIVAIHLMTQS